MDGKLGLAYSAFGRMVAWGKSYAIGDGAFGQQTEVGKMLIDQRLHWKSTYNCPVTAMVFVQRRRTTLDLLLGNMCYVRERYTWATGIDTTTLVAAADPTTAPYWDTECGGGASVSGQNGGTNRFRYSTPESGAWLEPITVNAGQSLDVRYRETLYTQAWAGGGSAGGGENTVYTFHNTIYVFALPEPLTVAT